MGSGRVEKVLLVFLGACLLAGLLVTYLRTSGRHVEVSVSGLTREERDAEEIIESSKKVNVNTAPASELELLPGVGPKLAEAIVEYRLEHGRFSSPEDIMKVPGIGAAKYDRIKEFLYTEEKDAKDSEEHN